MDKILNFINGQFQAPLNGEFLDNFEPRTGRAYSQVAASKEKDVLAAIAAAKDAFPVWSGLTSAERAKRLRNLGDLILKNLQFFAMTECRDTGKTLRQAIEVEIPRSARNFHFFADLITAFHGDSYETSSSQMNYTLHPPLGVVACITPWNLPLYLLTWKIAPALVAGNCVIAKPSEVTPTTANLLAQLCSEANIPPGVLNIIHGLGSQIGPTLCTHPDIKAVSFTGSTQTGRSIAEACAPHFKKVSLEMGGKNASVVFANVDLEIAVQGALRAAFTNQGQICLCGSRILVEEKIYSQFRDKIVQSCETLKTADPLKSDTDLGALVSKAHLQKVKSYIEQVPSLGGKILCGGKTPQLPTDLQNGYYLQPTLVEGLAPQSPFNQEEIFGPVASLIPFRNFAEAIEIANGTRYGLAASVWTSDFSTAHLAAQKLQAGMIWINTWMMRDLRSPFGGLKESGYGKEGGLRALDFFTEVKNIGFQFS